MAFLWFKALHIVAFVCWFAALFYLPRLFVYHAGTEDPISDERFKLMERRLYRGIGTPAMIATLIFGLAMLVSNTDYLMQGWMQAKLALVAALVTYHLMCGCHLAKFAHNQNVKDHIYFRWFNEVPTVALLAIVFFATLRPF